MENILKILHLTPHFGGGVGSVLTSMIQRDHADKHSVICLDRMNPNAEKLLNDCSIPFYSSMHKHTKAIFNLIGESDILLVHFWNHPLLYHFLVTNRLPASRMIMWGHISGLHPPNIYPKRVFSYPDKLVFTTQISLSAETIKTSFGCRSPSVIVSTSGIERFAKVCSKSHENFVIGYIGTADYSKLHFDFVKICQRIATRIPDARFHVLSIDSHDHLISLATSLGIFDKFSFFQKVNDIFPFLESFDIFGYPLQSQHFGTAEQILQEVMAAGIVPVVLNNPCEKSIVKDFGIIAHDIEDYIVKIIHFYNNRDELRVRGKEARRFALEEYSYCDFLLKWRDLFRDTMCSDKRVRCWSKKWRLTPYQIFLQSIGEYSNVFELSGDDRCKGIRRLAKSPNWISPSKGTPFQYSKFFPDDFELRRVCAIMKGENEI